MNALVQRVFQTRLTIRFRKNEVTFGLKVHPQAQRNAFVIFNQKNLSVLFVHDLPSPLRVRGRGRTIEKVLPWPGRLSISTLPPWALITWLTIARPKPEPSCSRDRRSSIR